MGSILVSYLCNSLGDNSPPSDSFFFFGGLSVHLIVAILAHMFSYNITWGATKKVCKND